MQTLHQPINCRLSVIFIVTTRTKLAVLTHYILSRERTEVLCVHSLEQLVADLLQIAEMRRYSLSSSALNPVSLLNVSLRLGCACLTLWSLENYLDDFSQESTRKYKVVAADL